LNVWAMNKCLNEMAQMQIGNNSEDLADDSPFFPLFTPKRKKMKNIRQSTQAHHQSKFECGH
jgi:hypothetical protein